MSIDEINLGTIRDEAHECQGCTERLHFPCHIMTPEGAAFKNKLRFGDPMFFVEIKRRDGSTLYQGWNHLDCLEDLTIAIKNLHMEIGSEELKLGY